MSDSHNSSLNGMDCPVSNALVPSLPSTEQRDFIADDYATARSNTLRLSKRDLTAQRTNSKKRLLGEMAATAKCDTQQPEVKKSLANAKHSLIRAMVDQGSSSNEKSSNLGWRNNSLLPNERLNDQSSTTIFRSAETNTTISCLLSTSSSMSLPPYGNQISHSGLLASEVRVGLKRILVGNTVQQFQAESNGCSQSNLGGMCQPRGVFRIGDSVEVREIDDAEAWELAEVRSITKYRNHF